MQSAEDLPRRLGSYTLLRQVGEGGEGVVFAASEPRFDGVVAVKTLRRRSAADRVRLAREFRRVDGLHHPNLVVPYELASADGEVFFSMPLVDGADIVTWSRERLERADAPDWDTVRALVAQTAEALDALHRRDVLHLDLKPTNALVTRDGVVRVLDFGLSSGDGDDRAARSLTGTPGYIAPEVLRGTVGRAADAFALGMLLFGMLTGSPPPRDLAWTHDLGGVAALLGQASPPVPDDLVELCLALASPDPAARPSLAALCATPSSPSGPSWRDAGPTHPVGRDALVATVLGLLTGTPAHPRVVSLEGPPGIGKSTVLAEARRGLHKIEGVDVIATRCHERDLVPFKVLDDLAELLRRVVEGHGPGRAPAWTIDVARLIPSLASPVELTPPLTDDPEELRRLAFDGLKQGLREVSAGRRLVLLVDDAQWGDADSARAIVHALSEPDPVPIDVVVSSRVGEIARAPFMQILLTGLADRPWIPARRLEVPPLEPHHVAELVRRIGTAGSSVDVDVIVHAAQGVPSLATWMASFADGGDHAAAASWEDHLAEHLAQQPEGVRDLLAMIALSDAPTPLHVLGRASQAPGRLLDALGVLKARRLVTSAGLKPHDVVEAYHQQLATVVASRLDPAQARALHQRLADAWFDAPEAPPDRLAQHLLAAGRPSEALPHALRAARAADAQLAFDRAAALYQLALDASPPDAGARRELSRARATALARAGRSKEAADLFLSLVEDAKGEEASELRLEGARLLLLAGWAQEGRDVLEPLLRAQGITWPASANAARLRAATALAGLRLQRQRLASPAQPPDSGDVRSLELMMAVGKGFAPLDPDLSGAFLLGALRIARRIGDPDAYADASTFFASLMSFTGVGPLVRWAHSILDDVHGLAESTRSDRFHGLHHVGRGVVATCAGRWDEADQHFVEGDRRLAPLGGDARWERNIGRNTRMLVLLERGDLRTLGDLAGRLWQEAEAIGDLSLLGEGGHYAAIPHLAAGRPDDALAIIDSVMRRVKSTSVQFPDWHALRFRTWSRAYRGDPDVRASFLDGFAAIEGAGLTSIETVRHQSAGMLVATTPRGEGATTARRVRKLAGRGTEPRVRALHALAQAIEAADVGDLAQTVMSLDAARASCAEAGQGLSATSLGLRLASLRGDKAAASTAAAELAQRGIREPHVWTRTVLPPWLDAPDAIGPARSSGPPMG